MGWMDGPRPSSRGERACGEGEGGGHWEPAGIGADFSYMVNAMAGNTAPQQQAFDLGGLDPGLVGAHHGQGPPGMDPYQVWQGMSHTMPPDLGDVNAMGGIYQ